MAGCGYCGRAHGDLPDEIAHRRPLDYFRIPESERSTRIDANDDLCVIDGKRFLIRAHLPIRVLDDVKPFGWGLWALVSREAYERYVELWDADGSAEPALHGHLSADFPDYSPLYLHELELHLGPPERRPRIQLAPSENRLYREQEDGITSVRRHEIFRTVMPWLFS